MQDILIMYNNIKNYLDKYNAYIKNLKFRAHQGLPGTLDVIEKVNYTLLINEQIEKLQQINGSNSNREILDNLHILYMGQVDKFTEMFKNNGEQKTISLFDLKKKLIIFLNPLEINMPSDYRMRTTTRNKVIKDQINIMRIFNLSEEEMQKLIKQLPKR
jgi:hypothetical protein